MHNLHVTTVEWATLLGILLPLLVSVINQPWLSVSAKHAVAVALAIVVGSATVFFTGAPLSWATIGTAVSAVYAASQFAYSVLWRPTGVSPAIESATSAKVIDGTSTVLSDEPLITPPAPAPDAAPMLNPIPADSPSLDAEPVLTAP